jgi:hypothetical protein
VPLEAAVRVEVCVPSMLENHFPGVLNTLVRGTVQEVEIKDQITGLEPPAQMVMGDCASPLVLRFPTGQASRCVSGKASLLGVRLRRHPQVRCVSSVAAQYLRRRNRQSDHNRSVPCRVHGAVIALGVPVGFFCGHLSE